MSCLGLQPKVSSFHEFQKTANVLILLTKILCSSLQKGMLSFTYKYLFIYSDYKLISLISPSYCIMIYYIFIGGIKQDTTISIYFENNFIYIIFICVNSNIKILYFYRLTSNPELEFFQAVGGHKAKTRNTTSKHLRTSTLLDPKKKDSIKIISKLKVIF